MDSLSGARGAERSGSGALGCVCGSAGEDVEQPLVVAFERGHHVKVASKGREQGVELRAGGPLGPAVAGQLARLLVRDQALRAAVREEPRLQIGWRPRRERRVRQHGVGGAAVGARARARPRQLRADVGLVQRRPAVRRQVVRERLAHASAQHHVAARARSATLQPQLAHRRQPRAPKLGGPFVGELQGDAQRTSAGVERRGRARRAARRDLEKPLPVGGRVMVADGAAENERFAVQQQPLRGERGHHLLSRAARASGGRVVDPDRARTRRRHRSCGDGSTNYNCDGMHAHSHAIEKCAAVLACATARARSHKWDNITRLDSDRSGIITRAPRHAPRIVRIHMRATGTRSHARSLRHAAAVFIILYSCTDSGTGCTQHGTQQLRHLCLRRTAWPAPPRALAPRAAAAPPRRWRAACGAAARPRAAASRRGRRRR